MPILIGSAFHSNISNSDFGGKILRIVRTFVDASGETARRVEIVRDPKVIRGYIRISTVGWSDWSSYGISFDHLTTVIYNSK